MLGDGFPAFMTSANASDMVVDMEIATAQRLKSGSSHNKEHPLHLT